MPVSGAQHACSHEMLQAAVVSMYRRDGSCGTFRSRCGGVSSFLSGSLSGQSPQNFEPPVQVAAQVRGGRAGPTAVTVS